MSPGTRRLGRRSFPKLFRPHRTTAAGKAKNATMLPIRIDIRGLLDGTSDTVPSVGIDLRKGLWTQPVASACEGLRGSKPEAILPGDREEVGRAWPRSRISRTSSASS